jgi:hypothetical protein
MKTSNPLYTAPDIPILPYAEVPGMGMVRGHYEAALQGSLLCLLYLLPVCGLHGFNFQITLFPIYR